MCATKIKSNGCNIEFWLGSDYDYTSSNKTPLYLICPAEGYKCGSLSKMYDNYDAEIKGKLLVNKQNNLNKLMKYRRIGENRILLRLDCVFAVSFHSLSF